MGGLRGGKFDYGEMSKVYAQQLAVKQPRTVKLPVLGEGGQYKLPSFSKEQFYVVCKHNGRYILLGPENTEADAYAMGAGKLHTTFKVVMFPTKDRAKATQMLRHLLVNNNSDLGLALQRMKHTV